MNIAITGATGFIGKNLVLKHLSLGDEVRVMTRKDALPANFPPEVKIYNTDLLNPGEAMNRFVSDVDILYHCAAEIKDETLMQSVNVLGTKNLIQAAKGRVKRWVQLSSTGAYGPVSSGIISESSSLNPVNMYERTKVESDQLVIDAGLNNYFNYSILRPSNVFGPDMKNQSLFQLIKAVDKGVFFFIGSAGARANYIPVENVVHALVLVGSDPGATGKIYNVSDSMSLEDFISEISKELKKSVPSTRMPLLMMKTLGFIGNLIPKSPITLGRVHALTNRAVYSTALIEKDLEYSPVISLKESLAKLVEAYRIKSNLT